MPRVLSRNVLREIEKGSLSPIELIDVSLDPPYTAFTHHFVNDLKPIVFESTTYSPLAIQRGNYEAESDEGVDRITLSLDDTAKFWAKTTQARSLQGCRIRVRKIFVGLQEDSDDAITIFDGFLGAPRFDDATVGMEIRSVLAFHNTELPTRDFGPSCPYFLGEGRCGVDMTTAPNSIEFIAGDGSGKAKVKAAILNGFAGNHWRKGYLQVLDGPEKGSVRPIDRSVGDTIFLFLPFNMSLQGSKVRVRRGCHKHKVDCDGVFDNLPRYGGFSEVPKSPAINISIS